MGVEQSEHLGDSDSEDEESVDNEQNIVFSL